MVSDDDIYSTAQMQCHACSTRHQIQILANFFPTLET